MLQTELGVLTDRLASGGRGGSAEDLAMYLKLSDTIAELMQTAGLGAQLQAPLVDQARGNDATAKLTAMLDSLIRVRDEEAAAGVFRDEAGNEITDPQRLALEKEIYRLQRARDALDNATTTDVTPTPVQPWACARASDQENRATTRTGLACRQARTTTAQH